MIDVDQRSYIYRAIKRSVNESLRDSEGNAGDFSGVVISPQYTHTGGESAGHIAVVNNDRGHTPQATRQIANIGIQKDSNGSVSYKLEFYLQSDSILAGRFGGNTFSGGVHDQVGLIWSLPADDPDFLIDWDSDTEQSKKVTAPANFGFNGYKTAVLQGKANTTDAVSGANATIYAEVYTNYEESKNLELDYRAGGIWVIIPEDTSASDDYHFGVFAQGSNPFQGGIDVALSGKATYTGNALGLHSYLKDGIRETKRLTGDVTIDVDFGTASQNGTIKGSINGLKLNGQAATGRIVLPRVNLVADAPAFGSSAGMSNADVEHRSLGSINGVSHLGSWTGAFLGDADTSANNIHPKAIIGTATARGAGQTNPTAFGLSFVAERPDEDD